MTRIILLSLLSNIKEYKGAKVIDFYAFLLNVLYFSIILFFITMGYLVLIKYVFNFLIDFMKWSS